MSVRYEDLFDAAAVVGTEQALLGRLDPAVAGVTCRRGEKVRVTGLLGRCANVGYLVLRLAGKTLAILDLAIVNVLTDFAAMDIDVPEGQTLSVGEMSTSGTGACSCTLRFEVQ